MPEIETDSIDMIATSPPYWGKRDYGEDVVAVWGGENGCEHEWQSAPIAATKLARGGITQGEHSNQLREAKCNIGPTGSGDYCSLCGAWRGQLGLEPTWQEFIAHLCECAAEWWRVLKPTGNLFVNIGDTFAGSGGHGSSYGRTWGPEDSWHRPPQPGDPDNIAPQSRAGPPKMKLGIPYRLRFALNDMGWVSRGDWIWYKGKDYGEAEYIARSGEYVKAEGKKSKVAMPESVKDRMSCSHEMVFHFVKEPKGYWFDLDAIRRPHVQPWRSGRKESSTPHTDLAPDGRYMRWVPARREYNPAGANPGDVWIIQPEPFKEAHYAVWPSELCERMIKVGCPKEVCPKCGKPRERITKDAEWYAELKAKTGSFHDHSQDEEAGWCQPKKKGFKSVSAERHTIGWSDCGCGEGFVPGVILDPFFGGSGRIAERALYLGRNVIGVDMKAEYLEMAKAHLLQGVLL